MEKITANHFQRMYYPPTHPPTRSFNLHLQAADRKAARAKEEKERASRLLATEEKARKKKAAALTRKHTADAEKKEESKQTAAKMGGNKKLGKVAAPSKKGCSTGSLVAVAVVCVCGVLYQLV